MNIKYLIAVVVVSFSLGVKEHSYRMKVSITHGDIYQRYEIYSPVPIQSVKDAIYWPVILHIINKKLSQDFERRKSNNNKLLIYALYEPLNLFNCDPRQLNREEIDVSRNRDHSIGPHIKYCVRLYPINSRQSEADIVLRVNLVHNQVAYFVKHPKNNQVAYFVKHPKNALDDALDELYEFLKGDIFKTLEGKNNQKIFVSELNKFVGTQPSKLGTDVAKTIQNYKDGQEMFAEFKTYLAKRWPPSVMSLLEVHDIELFFYQPINTQLQFK